MARGRKVLLVDDEQDVLQMTSDLLSLAGIEVVPAQSGPAAWLLLQSGLEVDMLVTDHAMPLGMTGLDLAEKAMQQRPGLPVVLVSGYAREQLPPIPAGVAFLPKPYRVNQLLQMFEPPAP